MDMQQNSSMAVSELTISSQSDSSSNENQCGSCQCCGVTSNYKRFFDNETEMKFEPRNATHFQNCDYFDLGYSRKTDIKSHRSTDDKNEHRNEAKKVKHHSHTQNIENKTIKGPLITKKPRQRYQSKEEGVHKTYPSKELKTTLSDSDEHNSGGDYMHKSCKHKALSTNYNKCDVSYKDALTPMSPISSLDRRQCQEDQDVIESQNSPHDQQSFAYQDQSDSDRPSNKESSNRIKSCKKLNLTGDAITGGENSFFQLYDRRVRDFQQERKDNEELCKVYYRIKRYFIILSFCNVIVLISILTMVPITFLSVTLNGQKHETVKPEWSETSTQIKHFDEIKNNGELDTQTEISLSSAVNQALFCLECRKMATLDVNTNMDKYGRCCFKDMWDVIQSIVKTTDTYTEKLKKEIIEDVRRYQQPADRNSYKTTGHDDNSAIVNAVNLDKIWSIAETIIAKKRAAIHLKNKGFSNKSSQPNLEWYYDDRQGDLQMSSDNMSIRIESGGYYFLYSKILYIRNTLHGHSLSNVKLSYQVFKKSDLGPSLIGEAIQRCAFSDAVVEHDSSIQTVTYLEQGASVYLTFPANQRQYISPVQNVHVLGMFEL